MNKKLFWKNIGKVPAQKDQRENIGTAGLIKGTINDYLIIGGGANFPNGTPIENGTKVIYSDIYLYKEIDGNLKLIEQTDFPFKTAYGATAQTKNTLYYIGMENKTSSKIIKISIQNEKLFFEELYTLPFSVENIIAEVLGDYLYFGIGSINGTNSNELYRYCLKDGCFEVISNFPGLPRSQAISYAVENSLIIYGGGASVTYNDGFSFDTKTLTWNNLSPVVINDEELSLLGADRTLLNENELLIIGGFNKDVWKEATYNLNTLTGDARAEYRTKYFTMPVEDYHWNKKELIYNFAEDKWYKLGEINFYAPCGHALLSTKKYIYSIMGEIKPAVRSPFIQQCKK
ncbi:putative phage head-tail adaptor [Gemella bergeri ATCC 700627]|uniref:Putative phage head-tail adaptor n=1 Tax=Gemella bergeri ATCC 700627 TaxID=1321820 RepID=U2Q0Y4_9BACL|nr:cyclically-permuted mutarotase family protein [Gemella bergeri]ERK56415.1 putative phage head-tail adaptor [Gemella bergeri ATCC 700627]